MENEKFNEFVNRVWPKTKRELEKGMVQTRKLIDQSEVYIKDLSKKGMVQTQKLSLTLKKEKLCRDLGKLVAGLPKAKWETTRKIGSLIRQIKAVDRTIKKLK